MKRRDHIYRPLIFFATVLFVVLGTYFVIRYAKGDRLGNTGVIKGTGLLSANSFPSSAQVYINGRLTTATDNTLNLDPGEYQVEIKKDGFHSWSKTMTITPELVTPTNAQLFPVSPALEPLTYTGALSPTPSSDGNLLVFAVASSSASTKNGLYIQELSSSPITLNKNARQIAQTTPEHDYALAQFVFSPNSSEILVSFPSGANLLLDSATFNDPQELVDVTWQLSTILSDWELELARVERVRLLQLPSFFQDIATRSGQLSNLYFSPDGKKLLYQAKANLSVPDSLIPALPATSTQKQARELTSNTWYVYDLIEDKNFFIAKDLLATSSAVSKLMLLSSLDPIPAETTSSPSAFKRLQDNVSRDTTFKLLTAQYSAIYSGNLQWYPDSAHIISHQDNKIEILEYDGTNRLTLYAGPFDNSIVYPWPDGSKVITRIQFSEGTIPNLYTIKLK
jgi:hypothetical protein